MKKLIISLTLLGSISSIAGTCFVEVNIPLVKDGHFRVETHEECLNIANQVFASVVATSVINGVETASKVYDYTVKSDYEPGWQSNGLRYNIHGEIIGDRRTKEQIKNPDHRKRNRWGELID